MAEKKSILTIDPFTVHVRAPESDGHNNINGSAPVIALLHGWTGDENSMWVFDSRLPQDALIIAPRGLYPSPLGGYSWQPARSHQWPWVDDFRPAFDALLELLTPENFPTGDFSNLRLVGFSQGAALAYTFALYHPDRIQGVAGLSGFLPEGADALARNQPLRGKPVFVAHGTQDEIVPVERARSAISILEAAGAQVSYCEDDVGHKLSLTCFKSLETFLGH